MATKEPTMQNFIPPSGISASTGCALPQGEARSSVQDEDDLHTIDFSYQEIEGLLMVISYARARIVAIDDCKKDDLFDDLLNGIANKLRYEGME